MTRLRQSMRRFYPSRPTVAALALVLATALAAPQTLAQQRTPEVEADDALRGMMAEALHRFWPGSHFTDSPHLRAVFRPVVAETRRATVEVLAGGLRVALGGVVRSDGLILTKASELGPEPSCRFSNGRRWPARVVAVDAATDLALLRVEASDLPTLELGPRGPSRDADRMVAVRREVEAAAAIETSVDPAPRAGDWLATVGRGRDPIAIGVMSVAPRPTEKRPGFLGIVMGPIVPGEAARPGVLVQRVVPGGAADKAGLRPGDRITAVDGEEVADRVRLKQLVGDNRHPGDRLRLSVLRGADTLELTPTLTGWKPSRFEERADYQNRLGGELSQRRFGFESVFQHDTVLAPNDCGGPVVDVDGRVVGFNIARAGRTDSYALPIDVVREQLSRLMADLPGPSGS